MSDITTENIANNLNISRSTVSRVINNQPKVSQKTRKLVLDEIARLGYTPNLAAKSLAQKRTYRIAVVVFSQPDFFWKQVKNGVDVVTSELTHMGLRTEYYITDINNPAAQVELVKKLSEQKFDAIALAPNSPTLLINQVDEIINTKFPVMLFNVDIPSVNRLCYVGCDYTKAGALAAEVTAKSICYKGDAIVLALKDPVISIDQRITGFRSEISKYPDIIIHDILRFNRLGEGVYDRITEELHRRPDLKAIYVGFGVLETVARAVENAGFKGQITLVGYDLSEEINYYLENGVITATICHEPFMQGYLSVKLLFNYLNRNIKPYSSSFYTRLEVVYATNSRYYLEERSYHDWLSL